MFQRHRRYLAADDPERTNPAFGDAEQSPPPPDRVHADAVRDGLEADSYRGPAGHHPQHRTSVKWWCPLAVLPHFDLVQDFVPDMMHIVKDFFTGHYIPLFKGSRMPKPWTKPSPQIVRKRGKVTPEAIAAYEKALARWEEERAIINNASLVSETYTLKTLFTFCSLSRNIVHFLFTFCSLFYVC